MLSKRGVLRDASKIGSEDKGKQKGHFSNSHISEVVCPYSHTSLSASPLVGCWLMEMNETFASCVICLSEEKRRKMAMAQ